MAIPQGMHYPVFERRADGSAKPIRYGLVKVKSQVRKPNEETGRKRWTNHTGPHGATVKPVEKPSTRKVDPLRFARGDRFGRDTAGHSNASGTETWRGRRKPA
jgi:hypothetical protein